MTENNADDAAQAMQVLLAPQGLLSGDGQLRELIQERRNHLGGNADIWYLPSVLTGTLAHSDEWEALAIRDAGTAAWLHLRLGGELMTVNLSRAWLDQAALKLPAPAPLAQLS